MVTNAPPLSITVEVTLPVFQQIFSQFQHVANAEGRLPPAKHKTVHHIKKTGPPATSRFRRLDAAKLVAAKADFMKLERDGIIRRSSSTWSAPLHMVMKPDGTWRPCSDYHRLNLVTKPDSFCYLDNILIARSSKEEHHQHLQLVWSPAMRHSFQLINNTLASVAVLTHPDPAAEVNLAVDASNTHVGAVLHQRCTGSGGDLWDFLARSWMRPS